MKFDVCIIGGGAAGLAAASSLNHDLRICMIEKNQKPGRKLLATGGGRCNITNSACAENLKTLDFFRSLGLEMYCDAEGRYFPYTNRASDVVTALTRSLGSNVSVHCGTAAVKIEYDGLFHIVCRNVEKKSKARNSTGSLNHSAEADLSVIDSDYVILASGGKAAPQFGTTGDGYRLAADLGHTHSRLYPILAGVECTAPDGDRSIFDEISGIRATAKLKLIKSVSRQTDTEKEEFHFAAHIPQAVYEDDLLRTYMSESNTGGSNEEDARSVSAAYIDIGNDDYASPDNVTGSDNSRVIAVQSGEVQFTDYGISGICVFNLTPYIRSGAGESFRDAVRKYQISIDFAPDIPADAIRKRNSSFGIVTEKLSEHISVKDLKDWRLQVTGVRGWREAQCTGGGIRLSEINMDTMESKIRPGLYFAGELIDMQGLCGGYNLQNAWETGLRAAGSINRKLRDRY